MNNPGLIKTLTAAAAIAAHRFVKFGNGDTLGQQASGPNDLVIGVSDLGADAQDDRFDVVLGGIALVTYGDTVVRGQPLTSDAQGRAVPAVDQQLQAVIAGGAAGAHTVTGIKTTDELVAVLQLDVASDTGDNATGDKVSAIADLTSEFSISGDDEIDNDGGTATAGDQLLVIYRRKDKVHGQAMVSGVVGDLGSVKL